MISTILADARGIARVCGAGTAVRWLGQICLNWRQCLRSRNLQPADVAMGDGPFTVRRGRARAKLVGEQVMTGLRELWVRDSYLGGDFLSIEPGAVVVDLGSNMGNFTLQALAHDSTVTVAAVEASAIMCDRFAHSLKENGWSDRATLTRAFLGGSTRVQQQVADRNDYRDAPWITEDQFIQRTWGDHPPKIDFLKCDIEGSEFELLHPESRLLALARQLAIEVHGHAGDCRAFGRMLESEGFAVHLFKDDGNCLVYHAKRINALIQPLP